MSVNVTPFSQSKSIPWHTTERHLVPYERMVRELYLMAITVDRDWTSSDTTCEQDAELAKIVKTLRRQAKKLNRVFERTH